MSFEDTKDAMFDEINSVFGQDVIYTFIADSSTVTIRGVFENAFVEVDGISTKQPILRNVILEELGADPVEGDQVEIDSIDYVVRYHEPDSHGSTTLILEKI